LHTLILPARDVVAATPRTRIITVDLGTQSFTFHAGQAVLAGLAEGALKRPYSIACSPNQARRLRAIELLVQIDDHEAPDPHLERVVPGTLLRVEGPYGSFGLSPAFSEPRLLLIAGGTGIAPLRSILWDVLESDRRVEIAVIYSARAAEEFAYADELSALATARRIELHLTVTRDSTDSWTGNRGRIDRALITSALTGRDTRAVVCGPSPFVTQVSSLLEEGGVREDRIVTETYVP
jgi:ferredoxin-NADP reductase